MTALILEPHQDDVALFCAFTAIRERAHVVTVLRDGNGRAEEREAENKAAMEILGCEWTQWYPFPAYPDSEWPDALMWTAIGDLLGDLDRDEKPERVYAPWPEKGGHPQHNRIGELAREVFGDRVTHYTTYRYGGPRSTGIPVQPEPEWILLKLRALACYRSQILNGPRRFFTHALDEWYAP